MYMLDIYHVMMTLYDISNFKNQNFFMVLYGFKKLNLTEKI